MALSITSLWPKLRHLVWPRSSDTEFIWALIIPPSSRLPRLLSNLDERASGSSARMSFCMAFWSVILHTCQAVTVVLGPACKSIQLLIASSIYSQSFTLVGQSVIILAPMARSIVSVLRSQISSFGRFTMWFSCVDMSHEKKPCETVSTPDSFFIKQCWLWDHPPVYEGFNDIEQVYMTLHTSGNCTFNPPAYGESGISNNNNYDCQLDNPVGCSVEGPVGSYGSFLNAQGGGVFAMEWTSTFIRVYFFPRNAIPADITAGNPDPRSWGVPAADFDSQNGDCDIDANFPPQTTVSTNAA